MTYMVRRNGQVLVVTGRVWMTRGELEMMEEV